MQKYFNMCIKSRDPLLKHNSTIIICKYVLIIGFCFETLTKTFLSRLGWPQACQHPASVSCVLGLWIYATTSNLVL